MQLTHDQKIILTVLEEVFVSESIELVSKYCSLSKKEIAKIIEFLLVNKLIEIIGTTGNNIYSHTDHVTLNMIDIDLAKQLDTPACHRFWEKIQKINPEYITQSKERLEDKL